MLFATVFFHQIIVCIMKYRVIRKSCPVNRVAANRFLSGIMVVEEEKFVCAYEIYALS